MANMQTSHCVKLDTTSILYLCINIFLRKAILQNVSMTVPDTKIARQIWSFVSLVFDYLFVFEDLKKKCFNASAHNLSPVQRQPFYAYLFMLSVVVSLNLCRGKNKLERILLMQNTHANIHQPQIPIPCLFLHMPSISKHIL